MKKSLITLTAISSLFLAGCDKKFDDDQKKDIETIVAEYIANHPEKIWDHVERCIEKKPDIIKKAFERILAEGMQKQGKKINQARETVKKYVPEIQSTKNHFSYGKADAEHKIVIFADYACAPCRKTLEAVASFVKSDNKDKDRVQFIIKPYPILDGDADELAKVMLAAHKQGKYQELQAELFKDPTLTAVMTAAQSINGLDVDKLEKDMNSSEVADILEETKKLGKNINIKQTPTLVINDIAVPSSIQEAELPEIIKALDKMKEMEEEKDKRS